MIFISSPYSHPNPAIKQQRKEIVAKLAAKLSAEGKIVFSPIIYGLVLCEYGKLPDTWEFWRNFCESFLDKCDTLYVLEMEGWEASEGVQAEINYAQKKGIIIKYIDPWKELAMEITS